MTQISTDDRCFAGSTAVPDNRKAIKKIAGKQTMREFDSLCLTPARPLAPEEIRNLRTREGAGQAVFARYLNVTTGLVDQWERGEKHPQGPSLKLLALVDKNGLSAVA